MGEKRPKQHGIPTGIKQKSAVQCAGVGMDAVPEAAMVKIFVFFLVLSSCFVFPLSMQ